jgi:PAS domain S-box-containing protein
MDRITGAVASKESGPSDAAMRPEMMAVHDLTLRLEEVQETLAAIRRGEIDALVVASGTERLVFVLKEADPGHKVLFDTMNEGALTLAQDTTILRANARFAELCGRPLDQVIGARILRFVAPGGGPVIARLLEQAATGRSKGEVDLEDGDGRRVPVLVSMSGVGEGAERSYTVVVTDLGPLKDAQRALEQYSEDLEAKVAARTDELYRANGALRAEIGRRAVLEEELRQKAAALAENDRRKDEFLSMLAHELRNPLAPIVTAVELLRAAAAESPKVERYRGVIDRQARHLSRLVDDLLDVSRLTRRAIVLRRQPLDLVMSVQSAVEAARPLIDGREHTLTVTLPAAPVTMLLDPTRFEQILVNLLNNAAKYTERGGRIWLDVAHDASEVVIRVRDTGIGLPPDLLPHVFDLFVQGERTLDRTLGGLGIGLTMVKSLVELHGGRVEARSEGAGKGSEFTVTLPLEEAPSSGEGAPNGGATDPSPQGQGRILVVEDNTDAAETLHDLVSHWGYEVFHAGDGESGLRLAEELRPAVVLIDIGLPGMDGYEVARRMRRRGAFEDLPVLIGVTGYGQPQDRELSSGAGIAHHLVKPLDPAMLRDLLGRCVPRADVPVGV